MCETEVKQSMIICAEKKCYRIGEKLCEISIEEVSAYLVYFEFCWLSICPGGGIGRRVGLKIRWWRHRAGSSPAPGTTIVVLPKSHLCDNYLRLFIVIKGGEACPAERNEGNEHSESGSPAPGAVQDFKKWVLTWRKLHIYLQLISQKTSVCKSNCSYRLSE